LSRYIWDITLAGQIEQETQRFVSLPSAIQANARIVQLKAGSIETAALQIGASLVGAGGSEPSAIGAHLARAYQTCNDLADLAGWLSGTRPALPQDLRKRTLTFPILMAIQSTDAAESELILRFMQGRDATVGGDDLRSTFLNADVYSRCLDFVGAQLRGARELLAGALRPGPYRDFFVHSAESAWTTQYLEAGG